MKHKKTVIRNKGKPRNFSQVEIHTDSSFDNNNYNCGIAYIAEYKTKNKKTTTEYKEGLKIPDNNLGELLAITKALSDYINTFKIINIYTDSKFSLDFINKTIKSINNVTNNHAKNKIKKQKHKENNKDFKNQQNAILKQISTYLFYIFIKSESMININITKRENNIKADKLANKARKRYHYEQEQNKENKTVEKIINPEITKIKKTKIKKLKAKEEEFHKQQNYNIFKTQPTKLELTYKEEADDIERIKNIEAAQNEIKNIYIQIINMKKERVY